MVVWGFYPFKSNMNVLSIYTVSSLSVCNANTLAWIVVFCIRMAAILMIGLIKISRKREVCRILSKQYSISMSFYNNNGDTMLG